MKDIARLRRDRGWSQAELARRARLHPSDISRFESGRSVPYPGQLRKLAKALGVPVRVLGEELQTSPGKET